MAIYQQGDVLLIPVKSIPKGATKRSDNHLAEGELTGHFHGATAPTAQVFEVSAKRFLSAPRGTTIKHQEHKSIKVSAGDYEVRIVQEYDHFAEEARAVRD
jgi:hypothetical protein